MKLSEILKNIRSDIKNDVEIKDICYDSRKAESGFAFVCIKGFESDGHKYAKSAYEKGCRVFFAEDKPDLPNDADVYLFPDTRKVLALASANLFGNPAKELGTIAITGTKGKTSTAFMIASILGEAGKKVGIIGTIGTMYGDVIIHSDNSTPESYLIHKYYRDMVNAGMDYCVMETSSQGFKLDRTYGIDFDIGIFTNLSPDHIGDGEHADYDEYRECKKKLFSQCKVGFFNASDKEAQYMESGASCGIIEFGTKTFNDYSAEEIGFSSFDGKLTTEYEFRHDGVSSHFVIPHPGKASVFNSLCAAAVCSHLGIDDETILRGLEKTVIAGRNELINAPGGFSVIIDYAHNELSCKSLFDTLEPYRKGKIFTVFGCGGNRSKLRRYAMGDIITRYSDVAVITSDNPRFEKVEDINADIREGIVAPKGEVVEIADRKEAIEYCLGRAEEKDIVLIVGKGHQNYEEIQGIKYPFDEKQIVRNYLGI